MNNTEREVLRAEFEAWFEAVELGDGDAPLPTPNNGRHWDDFVQRHAIAWGAWQAARAAQPAAPEGLADLHERLLQAHGELLEKYRALKSGAQPAAVRDGWLYGNSYYAASNPRTTDHIREFGGPRYTAPQPAAPAKNGWQVGCEGEDGLLRVHDESEVCDVCRPAAPAVPQGLLELCKETVRVHAETGCVLTTHIEQMAGLLAAPQAPADERRPLTKAQIDFILRDSFLAANGSVYSTRVYDFVAEIESAHGIKEQPGSDPRIDKDVARAVAGLLADDMGAYQEARRSYERKGSMPSIGGTTEGGE